MIVSRFSEIPDLTTIAGHEHAKRALEVAACGGHSLALTGAPGTGKTLLARALPGLLPPLSTQASQDLRQWYRERDVPCPASLEAGQRPICSGQEAMTWIEHALRGGEKPLGEIQHGLLLLERLDCFAYSPLQVQRLATILDHGHDVQMILTQQPCPCGWYGDRVRECLCSAALIAHHRRRMQALLERASLAIELPRLDVERLMERTAHPREPSARVAERVRAGAERQQARFVGLSITRNAEMDHAQLLRWCLLDASAQKLYEAAHRSLHFSGRAADSVLSVARTIADLAESERIQANHVAEAIQYQPR